MFNIAIFGKFCQKFYISRIVIWIPILLALIYFIFFFWIPQSNIFLTLHEIRDAALFEFFNIYFIFYILPWTNNQLTYTLNSLESNLSRMEWNLTLSSWQNVVTLVQTYCLWKNDISITFLEWSSNPFLSERLLYLKKSVYKIPLYLR